MVKQQNSSAPTKICFLRLRTVVIWLKHPSNNINAFELIRKIPSNNLRFYVSKHAFNNTYTELKISGLKHPSNKIGTFAIVENAEQEPLKVQL